MLDKQLDSHTYRAVTFNWRAHIKCERLLLSCHLYFSGVCFQKSVSFETIYFEKYHLRSVLCQRKTHESLFTFYQCSCVLLGIKRCSSTWKMFLWLFHYTIGSRGNTSLWPREKRIDEIYNFEHWTNAFRFRDKKCCWFKIWSEVREQVALV